MPRNNKSHKTGTEIQAAILQFVRKQCKNDTILYKLDSENGAPDLNGGVAGLYCCFEVKGPGDRIRGAQEAQARLVERAGCLWFEIHSLGEFKAVRLAILGMAKKRGVAC